VLKISIKVRLRSYISKYRYFHPKAHEPCRTRWVRRQQITPVDHPGPSRVDSMTTEVDTKRTEINTLLLLHGCVAQW
jgi:hypothetical protein